MPHIHSLARILFVLSVVFLSIYFLYSPPETINHPTSLSSNYIEAAIEETRIEIKESLKQFSFPSSIPGSNIKTKEDLLKFREHMDCISTKGKWVYDDTPRAILRHKQEPLYGRCDKNSKSLNKNASIEEIWDNSRNSVKYKWETPHKCPLPNFNREDFCSLITGLKFLLVGDVSSYQLHELLLDYFHDGPVQCYGEIACKDHILCRSPPPFEDDDKLSSVMRYARNDILSTRKALVLPEDNGYVQINNLQLPWTSYVYHSNVIILNKGHHYQDDTTFRSSLIRLVKYLRTKNPNTLLIFRSTTVGHLNCNNTDLKPLSNPYNAFELPYHWGEIHKQNMIAKEIIEAVGGVYWNLENVMETRIDDHIGGQDCIRWCIPGPSDIWLNLLFVLLKELKINQ